ncbi:hypothetical protein AB1I68_00350 [Paenibacillus pabuli]|uniref:hypothetical protein n=1 Tax=Paenibacillus pabuli TaxID=1472 RepID=UPI00345845CE
MKMIFKASLTCTLLFNFCLASVATASPEITDHYTTEKFIEVQTSGTARAKVGKFQGDNTIIMDEKGKQFTVGELKAQTNLVLPDSPDANVTPNITIQLAPHNDMVKPFASAYGYPWPYSQSLQPKSIVTAPSRQDWVIFIPQVPSSLGL